MEENTEAVEIPSENTMNPNTQLERVMAPVIVNSTSPERAYDNVGSLNNLGIQRLQHDVAETNRDVKDAEADIRHDVLFEGQENQKTALEVEARLKDRLSIDRNAWDLQFQNLGNRLCESEKTTMEVKTEVIKQGYEAKLSAKDAIIDAASRFQHLSERLGDKMAHGFEEINEKLDECCCENKLLASKQEGLLAQIVHAVVK